MLTSQHSSSCSTAYRVKLPHYVHKYKHCVWWNAYFVPRLNGWMSKGRSSSTLLCSTNTTIRDHRMGCWWRGRLSTYHRKRDVLGNAVTTLSRTPRNGERSGKYNVICNLKFSVSSSMERSDEVTTGSCCCYWCDYAWWYWVIISRLGKVVCMCISRFLPVNVFNMNVYPRWTWVLQ